MWSETVAMAAGRPNAVVVAVAALLLAGVARADCFDYCFKNCIAKDKSMTDYCNYACDKTCDPGATPRSLVAAAAAGGGDMAGQLSCAKTTCNRLRPDGKAVEACFGRCYDGCKTMTLPRPLRAGAGAGVPTALGPLLETGHSPDGYPLFPSSEPDPDDAASEKHPFHEKQDGVQLASEPDKDDAPRPASDAKDDDVGPASEPDPDDAHRPASGAPDLDGDTHPDQASRLDRKFHEKQDGVQPASEPDKDDSLRPAWGSVLPESEIHAAAPAPV